MPRPVKYLPSNRDGRANTSSQAHARPQLGSGQLLAANYISRAELLCLVLALQKCQRRLEKGK
jgi:hypothetical protein